MSEPPVKKPKLTGDEFLKLKEELRNKKKQMKMVPRIILNDVGKKADLSLITNNDKNIPLILSDIQHFILHSFLGINTPYNSRWCQIEKYLRIPHRTLFIIEGVSNKHYLDNESIFTSIKSFSDKQVTFISPLSYGGSIVEELVAVPLTGTQKSKLIKKFGSLYGAAECSGDLMQVFKRIFPVNKCDTQTLIKADLPVSDKFPRTKLLLSPLQLVSENYPLPLDELKGLYGKYVLTKDKYDKVTPWSPMFGLDCEMCKTTKYMLELTRISIVDEKMNVVYESFVKPHNKIIDYLTQYSGVTKDLLKNVTTRLADVQNDLRRILPADAILVGQSLNSDLHALQMMHPYVIDSSIIYNLSGIRSRKTKLKILSQEFLRENIQDHQSGHCSVEDSQAALKLVQLKLTKSLSFGDAVLQSPTDQNDSEISQNKFENKLAHQPNIFCTSIFNHITKEKDKTIGIVGCNDTMNEYSKYLKTLSLNIMEDSSFTTGDNIRFVIAKNNKKSVERSYEISTSHSLTLCHIKLNINDLPEDKLKKKLQSLNNWIEDIWQNTNLHGLLCVLFCGVDNSNDKGACFVGVKKK